MGDDLSEGVLVEQVEEWRPVQNFEGYEVSIFGAVRSWRVRGNHLARARRPHLLLLQRQTGGYLGVILSIDGRYTPRRVHRLVAEAFLGPCPSPKHQVAHGDGDRLNNRADNLRWATGSENQADRVLHGTDGRGDKNPSAILTTGDVLGIKSLYSAGNVTQAELGRVYGVAKTTIWGIVHGRSWAHVQLQQLGPVVNRRSI